jgi:hypothetical protein
VNVKTVSKRRWPAIERAQRHVHDLENRMNEIKKVKKNVYEANKMVEKKLKTEIHPRDILNLKRKQMKLNNHKQKIERGLENVQIKLDQAKNKLKAQKRIG